MNPDPTSHPRLGPRLADTLTAAFIAFSALALRVATRGDAPSVADLVTQAASGRFWLLGIALTAWVLLGISSLRFLHDKTRRDDAQALWRWGVLGWGGVMWVILAISLAADRCGGLSLRVFLCRDFTVDSMFGLVIGLPIWPWGGYAFGRRLFGVLGASPK